MALKIKELCLPIGASTISENTIATVTTADIGNTALKEVRKAGGRYNRVVRGYCNRRLLNGNICLKRSIWYYNGCSIRFERRAYYCKQKNRD